ncbi:DUF2079 domain-containing protein [Streptomyces triticirhizae]|uniref:DUF2079 domain-containing protein n=1 Tax=Streptomyces triticirhizae TaxID=2483353 RepID=A0A3M2MA56_9ACTN|nr:DUF2079 domain-containing protein [Streptomyces triticirhizae]RMI44008.1 DUF2079 domain-containing protein [Streptomyces triticirhizae]
MATIERDRAGEAEAPPAEPRRRLPGSRDPYPLAGVLFALYTVLSVGRYRDLRTRSWDLGIFEQAVASYARLREPVADLKGPGFLILGDHFSPVTALLAPFYRVFPSPVTLLVAQAALFALAAVPVTRVGIALLGRARGLTVGVVFGLSWGVQQAVDFDFHEICFAVPLIALALEALLLGRWRAALAWALPLVLVKEDLGLTTAAIALVVALRSRDRDPGAARAACAVAVGGAALCALTLLVLIPAFNNAGDYDYWTKLSEEGGGGGPLGALLDGIGEKARTLLWLLLPTSGLLALRSPLLLVALPTLGWRFVSHEPHYWGTDFHYSAVLMPVVVLALVDALANSGRSHRRWLRDYARFLPAGLLGATLALSPSLPVAQLTEAETWRPGEVAREAERVLAAVPDDAEVAANVRPIARLTGRCRVFWVGDPHVPAPDYLAYHGPGMSPTGMVERAAQLYPEAEYAVVEHGAGYFVLRRE